MKFRVMGTNPTTGAARTKILAVAGDTPAAAGIVPAGFKIELSAAAPPPACQRWIMTTLRNLPPPHPIPPSVNPEFMPFQKLCLAA
mmetsp:Transcript_4557/g.9573  ORF Transcript_4557/g.9573 Transcript_4557/m.9573 type:complete len:86 (-) Transcript_4557:110-367(-)